MNPKAIDFKKKKKFLSGNEINVILVYKTGQTMKLDPDPLSNLRKV